MRISDWSSDVCSSDLARARMVLVPINWRLTRPEVRFIAEDSGAALALVSDAFLADCTAALDGAVKVLPADSTDWIAGLPDGWHADAGTGDDMADRKGVG